MSKKKEKLPPHLTNGWYPKGTMKALVPVVTDQVTRAFPASIENLLPVARNIPEEFLQRDTPWVKFMGIWMFRGLPADTQFIPKEGIDAETAFYHIHCIMGSFAPKHEYKEAAVAYLCSLWFKDIQAGGKSLVFIS